MELKNFKNWFRPKMQREIDPIILELNSKEEDAKMYLFYKHESLSNLVSYIKPFSYSLAIESLYQDFYFKQFIMGEWGTDLISKVCISKLNEFHLKWVKYVNEKSYGDSFFVFYDKDWQDIVKTYLIPALDLFEEDLLRNKIISLDMGETKKELRSYKEFYNPALRPSDEIIIESINNIYKFLEDKKLNPKPYMGQDDW